MRAVPISSPSLLYLPRSLNPNVGCPGHQFSRKSTFQSLAGLAPSFSACVWCRWDLFTPLTRRCSQTEGTENCSLSVQNFPFKSKVWTLLTTWPARASLTSGTCHALPAEIAQYTVQAGESSSHSFVYSTSASGFYLTGMLVCCGRKVPQSIVHSFIVFYNHLDCDFRDSSAVMFCVLFWTRKAKKIAACNLFEVVALICVDWLL